MISRKANRSKGVYLPASGKRTRQSSIYKPNQTEDFKVSRSKFSDSLNCKRCFYNDRVLGLAAPGMPAWTLNNLTDTLLKKEFDHCREKQIPHRLFETNGLSHVVPFDHPDIDAWRDARHRGLKLRYKNTNIVLTGGIDDIWLDTASNQLIIVDYKSQAKAGTVHTEEYLNDIFHLGYKTQMNFYAYLLIGMGFDVHPISYFLVVNGDSTQQAFNSVMRFDEYLIPYELDTSKIEGQVDEMISLMNQNVIPEAEPSCENCAYSEQYIRALYPH